MAHIVVDTAKLDKAASAIDTYINNHKKKMKYIDNEVSSLCASWSGKDYTQFYKEWHQINAKDSVSGKMITALNNYADFLRFSENEYRSAQSKAVNRSNSLPRY